eukprot:1154523-Pelagomonas_calceolata.AAC.2
MLPSGFIRSRQVSAQDNKCHFPMASFHWQHVLNMQQSRLTVCQEGVTASPCKAEVPPTL